MKEKYQLNSDTKIGLDNPALDFGPEDNQPVEAKPNSDSDTDVDFEDLPAPDLNKVEKILALVHIKIRSLFQDERYERYINVGIKVLIGLLCKVYFIAAIFHYTNNNDNDAQIEWCDGLGFLIIMTVVVDSCIIYFYLLKPSVKRVLQSRAGRRLIDTIASPVTNQYNKLMSKWWASVAIDISVFLAVLIFLLIDTANDRRRLVSFFGLCVLICLAVLGSNNPSRIRWRSVIWGLVLQLIFGLLILRWEVGRSVFECFGKKITTFLAYSDDGSSFVYGYLVNQQPFYTFLLEPNSTAFEVATAINTKHAIAGVFMFKILSVIFFFSFFTSMLFYLGYMQWIISKLGWLLQITIGTTPCESMTAAANIFLGQSEAPLVIKPFLSKMTNSELHCVMTSGMATIAGSVLAAYISFNISASHLLSASVMSAPAALAAAKLLFPETKKTKTSLKAITQLPRGEEANLLDAASQGASAAVFLVANIAGSLIAVIAFVAFVNGMLEWFCTLIGYDGITVQFILGKIFIPLAWLMGVDEGDLEIVGRLLGIKSFLNEFVAYSELASVSSKLSPRSKAIATYALCGFANPASIGILIAAFGTWVPERRNDISKCAIRAYVAGSLACFLTACVAGALLSD